MKMRTRPLDAERLALFAPFFLAALTFLAYLPSLEADFVNWDDQLYVLENPRILSIDLQFLKAVFTEASAANWHPLTIISHAVDYAIWGLDPFGHHLTSVVLHSVNTALVFVLGMALASAKAPRASGQAAMTTSLVAALLFGLHPLHVESVAWVSERKDVLCGLFFVLSLLSYVKYSRQGPGRWLGYSGALIFFALAAMSKPMAVTLPAVLLILDFYPLGRLKGNARGALLEKAPFFALSAASAALTLWAQGKGGALATVDAYPVAERAAAAVRSLWAYLHKMLWPADLAVFYPMPAKEDVFTGALLISLAFVLLATAYCAAMARRRPIFPAVWAYYVITLVPVIGLVQVGNQAMADRYAYLPSIGPFLLAGAGVAAIRGRLKGGPRAAFTALCALWLLLLAGKAVRHEGIWKDSVTLWNHQISAYPEVALGYNNRGQAYEKLGRLDKALDDFNEAIRLKPGYTFAHYNRAFVRHKTGDLEGAIQDYSLVIGKTPGHADSFINRGICLAMLGRLDGALDDFGWALGLEPTNPSIHYYLGITYSDAGQRDKAADHLRKAYLMGYKEARQYLDMLEQ